MKPTLIILAGLVLGRLAVGAEPAESLPAYQPEQQVHGTIRNFGSGFYGLVKRWEDGFLKVQPGIKFGDDLPSSDAAMAGLIKGDADLAPSGRELSLDEYLGFYEATGHNPVEITVGTGTFDVPGGSWGIVVFVSQSNPLARLTLKQLDGIFGSERTGAYTGFKWMPQKARGPEGNIRTWGQLGLTGAWADRPIQTYGYAPSGMSAFFQLQVFGGGDKWNPNYREYIENGTKIMSAGETGARGGILRMLAELARDPYGIGWAGMPQFEAAKVSGLKAIALAASEGGPYVAPTKQTMADRTYPLARRVYIYLNRPSGLPVDPKLREFLRFILSREGQRILADHGTYLPLTPAVVREQRTKLD